MYITLLYKAKQETGTYLESENITVQSIDQVRVAALQVIASPTYRSSADENVGLCLGHYTQCCSSRRSIRCAAAVCVTSINDGFR